MTVTEESKDNLITYYRRELEGIEQAIKETRSKKEKERLHVTRTLFEEIITYIKASKREKEVRG
ncbi:MAG: hypothetical protein AYK18_14930 [Theionarchaea archaeon DG-70]|nr:MAG: hypothetical protein AYK18_14930 [Theionarchaea archaeon DG-70]